MKYFRTIQRLAIRIALGSALCAPAMAAPGGVSDRDSRTDRALSAPQRVEDAGVDWAMGSSGHVGEIAERTSRASNSICTWQSCAPRAGDSPWPLAGFGLATGAAVWLGRKPRD